MLMFSNLFDSGNTQNPCDMVGKSIIMFFVLLYERGRIVSRTSFFANQVLFRLIKSRDFGLTQSRRC